MTGIARNTAGWILASMSGVALAQGDGGSQTRCELQYSTCKQTANADYQFCTTASGQACQERLDAALRRCSAVNENCQDQGQGPLPDIRTRVAKGSQAWPSLAKN